MKVGGQTGIFHVLPQFHNLVGALTIAHCEPVHHRVNAFGPVVVFKCDLVSTLCKTE